MVTLSQTPAALALRLVYALATGLGLSGCAGWHGPNSIPLPGTAGHGAGAYTVQAQLPDIDNIDDITESLGDEPRFVRLGGAPATTDQPLTFDVDRD